MPVLSAPVIKYSQVLPWKMVGLMTLKPQACPFWNLKDQPLNGWIQTNKGTGRDKMPCITSSGCSKLYKFTTLNCSPNVGELLLDANAWKVSYIKISQNGKILFFHHAFRWPSFEKAHPRAGKKNSTVTAGCSSLYKSLGGFSRCTLRYLQYFWHENSKDLGWQPRGYQIRTCMIPKSCLIFKSFWYRKKTQGFEMDHCESVWEDSS